MAAYRRVYDLTSPAGWLPRTGISSGTLRSVIEYGPPFLKYLWRDFGCKIFFIINDQRAVKRSSSAVILTCWFRVVRASAAPRPASPSRRCPTRGLAGTCRRSASDTDPRADSDWYARTRQTRLNNASACRSAIVLLQVSVAEGLARLTAVWEDPGLNHAADSCVYRDSCCDTQSWARAVHLYCSA